MGMRDAKANLSRVIPEVKAGREVLITEYGQPVARVVPMATMSLEDRIAEMEPRRDIVRNEQPAGEIQPLCVPEGLAQIDLQEGREECAEQYTGTLRRSFRCSRQMSTTVTTRPTRLQHFCHLSLKHVTQHLPDESGHSTIVTVDPFDNSLITEDTPRKMIPGDIP